MVKIRLSRTGRKNYANYRIVVTEAREKRDSKFIEILGNYNPHTKELNFNTERAQYWLGVGAQPTETVKYFFIKKELIKKPSYVKKFTKKPGKKITERAKKASK